jgi:glycosyltransferase involved in cell wall biosynthesis
VKVAIIAPLVSPIREPQLGGSQAFLSELALGLTARGHGVHLYAAAGSQVPGVQVIETGVDHRDLEATLYRRGGAASGEPSVASHAFGRVYALVRERRYDVVHNHAFDAPAVTLASNLCAAVVHTIHLPRDRDVADALREAVLADRAPTVACVSVDQANAWRKVVPVDAILPPYIPTRQIRFSLAAGSGAVFAGRLSPEKGAAEAIAIARLAGIRIDVFGDRYDVEYARKRIDPRSAEPGVGVRPGIPQKALWEAMARAAVVLCPARWEEPFGMAAAEAQACGTPVVAFRRGALSEVIVDGLTGFLVAPDDLRAAADAVRSAPALSRRACRDHAESHLDIDRSLEAHEQLYERLIGAAVTTCTCTRG